MNMLDKAVLEIGAGTGLLSIVACLLGESISGVSNLSDVGHMLTANACHTSTILVFVFARLRDLYLYLSQAIVHPKCGIQSS